MLLFVIVKGADIGLSLSTESPCRTVGLGSPANIPVIVAIAPAITEIINVTLFTNLNLLELVSAFVWSLVCVLFTRFVLLDIYFSPKNAVE